MDEGSESRFSEAHLDELVKVSEWLEAQIMYLIYESPKLRAEIHIAGQRMRIPKPPTRAKDWDGILSVRR